MKEYIKPELDIVTLNCSDITNALPISDGFEAGGEDQTTWDKSAW